VVHVKFLPKKISTVNNFKTANTAKSASNWAQPGDKMLDIGCRWGTLARYTNTNYGAHATGISLSKNKTAWGNKCLVADEIPSTQSFITVYDLSRYSLCYLQQDHLPRDGLARRGPPLLLLSPSSLYPNSTTMGYPLSKFLLAAKELAV